MIVVVGAGPAGLAAAVRAHESGARVTAIDDNPAPGGQIWRGDGRQAWVSRFHASGIPLLANSRVIAGGESTLLVETPRGPREIEYEQVILATGAREIFLPFPGWTLPGVMGAGGLQALAKCGLPVAGKKVVVGGSGPLLIAVAAYLRQRGANVKLIAEQAPWRSLAGFGIELLRNPAKLLQGAGLQRHLAGVPWMPGCWVAAAEGGGRVERVTLQREGKTWTEECDYAAIGYGLQPNTELAALLGCAPNIFAAGECTGIGGVDLAIVEGEIAGYAAAGNADRARSLVPRRDQARRFAAALNKAFTLREELKRLPKPATLVCRCEDVTHHRLLEFDSFRAAKLHTRCGMGPCQGRVCGPAAEFLFGWKNESVRPPLFPARIGSLLPDKTTTAL
jgi:NADPH-dependent 2,4-dienoyl-CoA reductase/sulfur reductase-like enzyme